MTFLHAAAERGLVGLTVWVFGKEWQGNARYAASDGWRCRFADNPADAAEAALAPRDDEEGSGDTGALGDAFRAALARGLTGFTLWKLRDDGEWRATAMYGEGRTVERVVVSDDPVAACVEALTKRGTAAVLSERPTEFGSIGVAAALRLLSHEMMKQIEARR